MPRDLKLYLWDMYRAGTDILTFTNEKNLQDYLSDSLVRAAVERKFEIIGEALAQARELYPEIREAFDDHKEIVALRNRVIHGYFSVQDTLIWSILKVYLPPLLVRIEAILKTLGE